MTFPKSYTILIKWKRWFAWRPVHLQMGGIAWLCDVEYEKIQGGSLTGAFGGGPWTVTHYRMPDDADCFKMGAK